MLGKSRWKPSVLPTECEEAHFFVVVEIEPKSQARALSTELPSSQTILSDNHPSAVITYSSHMPSEI